MSHKAMGASSPMCDLLVVRCSNIFCALHHSWRARGGGGGGMDWEPKGVQWVGVGGFTLRGRAARPCHAVAVRDVRPCVPMVRTTWAHETTHPQLKDQQRRELRKPRAFLGLDLLT